MNFLEKYRQHKLEIILISLIILFGIFLRTYNFSDWLHFEIDQSYDTLLVSPAVENGIGNLPLLGPTAGGGRSLRLGPAFYYMEYLSAKIFGNTPTGHAMLVLILSILSLPLFYIFSRRYFSRYISISLLSLWSVSLYMVMYSRFSWSPNVLPFLLLLTFYSLLRTLSVNEKKRDVWFLITFSAFALITQIHFNAFFTVPAIIGGLFIIRRPKIKIRTWAIALLIFTIFYSPIIISDIKTNGQNLQYFIERFTLSGESNNNIQQKIVQTINYHASNYLLILTGIDHVNGKKLVGYGFSPASNNPWKIGALFILFLEIIILLFCLIKEKNSERKDFLWLSTLWFFITLFYFFFVRKSGLNIYPRFFLVSAPLAFIFFGLILEKLSKIKKYGNMIIFLLLLLLLYTNTRGITTYFSQLEKVGTESINVATEDVFPNTARITLKQQLQITDYIESIFKKDNFPVFINAKREYKPVIWYHLEKRGISFNGEIKDEYLYKEAHYFKIQFHENSFNNSHFDILEKRNFGSLIVLYLAPKPEYIAKIHQSDSEKEISLQKQQISQLFTWNKLFSGKKEDLIDKNTEDQIKKIEETEIREDAIDTGMTEEEVREE